MSYGTSRKSEIRHEYLRNIKRFASAYDRSKDTVIMLPGGMGSQLERSAKKYVDNASLPFRIYDPVWMDLGLLFSNDRLKLENLATVLSCRKALCAFLSALMTEPRATFGSMVTTTWCFPTTGGAVSMSPAPICSISWSG